MSVEEKLLRTSITTSLSVNDCKQCQLRTSMTSRCIIVGGPAFFEEQSAYYTEEQPMYYSVNNAIEGQPFYYSVNHIIVDQAVYYSVNHGVGVGGGGRARGMVWVESIVVCQYQ
ncbi:hypothetical protein DPMN_127193 [Dreissena polymorpha]|uniref:Uncharacterized protein n=1 Tax=Dreissena polymorpha TaxID=45954 RepID=A0A9D4JWA7_DREPO|nr:hypothetical protein DPMN_127193 [Dreissena polymorpha]